MINEYLKIKVIGVLDEPLKLCYHYLEKLTIAQNKYRTDVLCNLFLFILCVNDIINKVHEVQ